MKILVTEENRQEIYNALSNLESLRFFELVTFKNWDRRKRGRGKDAKLVTTIKEGLQLRFRYYGRAWKGIVWWRTHKVSAGEFITINPDKTITISRR